MFSGLPAVQPKRWTTIFSFTLQAAIVSAALVYPLLYPHGLPEAFARRPLFAPIHDGEIHAVPDHDVSRAAGSFHREALVVHQSLFAFHPDTSQSATNDSTQAPSIDSVIAQGSPDGLLTSIGSGPTIPAPRLRAPVAPPRVSRMMEGNLIHRVDPQYPVIAKQAGVQGTVVIKAIISRDGAIEREELVSGPTLLAAAALQAVRQWKYRPYFLNSEPVEVETQITVNFVLNR